MNTKNKTIRVAACSPKLKIANPDYNIKEMLRIIEDYCTETDIFVFPELCITGYSCADLFMQSALINKAWLALLDFAKNTSQFRNNLFVVGLPIRKDNQLFNCAAYVINGQIIGIVPKTYIPNYNEFYEKRWFASADNRLSDEYNGIPFSPNLLFKNDSLDLCIGTDICEDLWMPIPPSSYHAMYGANVIVNLSASNEVIAKSNYRLNLVSMQSAKCICGYVYASASQDESTTDVVFSAHKIIASNGSVLADSKWDKEIVISTIDLEKLNNDRAKFNSFMGHIERIDYKYIDIPFLVGRSFHGSYNGFDNNDIISVNPYPFVPKDTSRRRERCQTIFDIQSISLAQRMKKTGINKLVIGISGGLDSTLALLVAANAIEKLNLPMSNIIGITMPGFGTTKRTKNNSLQLMSLMGITQKTVSIVPACEQHFKDIGHSPTIFDVTYENVQARERTQILMDTANKEGALVVGTGDLSELALGWCTYNGDHMSMYAVNASIPKTLVKYLIMSIAMDYAENGKKELSEVLSDICDTPISPELLPTDKDGNIVQKTEESIGKYDLHDFFLYHMMRNGFAPSKIYSLAKTAYPNIEEEVILNTLRTFYKRFFSQQFKRSCLPDGPKVGSVALSPRGDWRMPSDACMDMWLNELDNF